MISFTIDLYDSTGRRAHRSIRLSCDIITKAAMPSMIRHGYTHWQDQYGLLILAHTSISRLCFGFRYEWKRSYEERRAIMEAERASGEPPPRP